MHESSNDISYELQQLSGWLYDGRQGYSLGMLLRKLPSFINTISGNAYRLNITIRQKNDDKEAQVGYVMLRQLDKDRSKGFEQLWYRESSGKHGLFTFGTLEDAAASMAIELFKQGLLDKENHDDSDKNENSVNEWLLADEAYNND